ncbi:MAG TPA: sensor domain-containing diguanylate cyclase [Blastocatellia bacterium]|nr:sensor domain-containing diguanylate cyclase [Blastocatellia bacterium]
MYSLFYVLSNQHGDEFAPIRSNEQTVKRLVGYFEDVVTEQKLSALVLEGRCMDGDTSREIERCVKLAAAARQVYLFTCDQDCSLRTWNPEKFSNLTALEECEFHKIESGPFILVMEPRFCGMLTSYVIPEDSKNHSKTYEMVWTFDPNVVFTAAEYLMARICAQKPEERARLEALLNLSTTRNASLRLALTFTTKLAALMQRQNELEMAINRISSAISSSLELESVLQSAVEEVGRALMARRAALVLWQEGTSKPEGMSMYERAEEAPQALSEPKDCNSGQPYKETATDSVTSYIAPLSLDPAPAPSPVDDAVAEASFAQGQQESSTPQTKALARFITEDTLEIPGPLEVPITYRNSVIGVLVVEDDTPNRRWEDEEVLMVKTVSDQLAVAISHARLFRHVQTQAMTDALTGLFNHRYLQERLDREIKLADRNNDQVSLILLDMDHLKRINDTHGHRSGDAALCHAAQVMRASVREVDICARYGGEEFVVILPQCGREDAIDVAERIREAIASKPVAKIGQVTASIGVATYPAAAKNKEELIEMSDRAMYLAKAAGRNRVRTLMHRSYTGINI